MVTIKYPLDFQMDFEDSDIPAIGTAILVEKNGTQEIMLSNSGNIIVLLDTRMKKFIYPLIGKIEKLSLVGWFSLKDNPRNHRKYVVFHVYNAKLIDAMYSALISK